MKNKDSPSKNHSNYSDLRSGTPQSQNKLNSSFSKTSHEKPENYDFNQCPQTEPHESRYPGKNSLERIINTCLVETNISPDTYKETVSLNGDIPVTTPFQQASVNPGRTSIPKRRQNQNPIQGPTCANGNCNNPKKHKRKFLKKTQMYCDECSRIIDNSEYCHICLEISSAEPREWVECERCDKWNHIECEETAKNGTKNLAAQLGLEPNSEPTKFVYHCANCRSTPNTNPKKNVVFEMPPTKILKSAEKNDFQPLNLLKHRRAVCRGPFDEQFYQYFYSENYQPIDKLVSSTGRSVYASDEDWHNDQTAIYTSVRQEYKENGIEDISLWPKINGKKKSSDSDLMMSTGQVKNETAHENGKFMNGIVGGTRKKRLGSESRLLRKKS